MLDIISLSKSEILSGSERDAVTSLCTSERFIVVGIDNGLVGIFDQKGIETNHDVFYNSQVLIYTFIYFRILRPNPSF